MQANRPLFHALLISAALHLLLIWPQGVHDRPRSLPLSAQLVRAPAVVVPQSGSDSPVVVSAPAASQSRRLPQAAAGSAQPPLHAPVHEVSAVAAQRLPLPAHEGLDAGAVRELRLAFAGALQGRGGLGGARFLAQNGQMHVYVQWLPGGVFAHASIVQGSGNALLDGEVLAAIDQAARQMALPAGLQERAFGLDLTLAY